ncbi:MAG: hypothetical protein HY043_12045 [Verrucomicrobia bacterium]|nr:hypothetical protein [Verrucomicrobiota bacterium]
MEITFNCPKCNQELAVDASAAGSEITCPVQNCGEKMVVPAPNTTNIHPMNPMASSAAAKEEHHFKVPVHEGPTEVLVAKVMPTLEVAADGEKKLRIRCIKRTECVEVGKDKFEEVVSAFLGKIGETNVVSINTINYTHIDMGTRAILTDFGVMIVFKG